MADKSSQLVLSALTRAAADTAGAPLHGTRSTPGLFPSTALGKQAAQRCREEGYLSAEGDAIACTITDKGLDYLLGQVSPRQVLEDFVRVLESRERQVGELVETTRCMQSSLETLRGNVKTILARLGPTGGDLKSLFSDFRNEPAQADTRTEVRTILSRWAQTGAAEDCSLPDLFSRLTLSCPGLSIGAFHDVLRGLHDAGTLYLHPWTGPLYAIPQPPLALMVGHEIAYYASLRDQAAIVA